MDWMLNKNTTNAKRLEAFEKNMKHVVEGNEESLDLRKFDLVFFPILEKHHFYLIVFDLKNPSISVIDNMHLSSSLIKMKDNTRFLSKGTPFKVVS